MDVRARLKNLRMSPKKVRLVVDLIRGMDIDEAKDQLQYLDKRAVRPVKKLLDSALANAIHNFKLKEDNLYVKKITVDGGPVLKRWMPRAFGRAAQIIKRSSHVEVILGERVPTIAVESKKIFQKENKSEETKN